MSFISDYLHCSTDNETPPMFHLWSGMFCLAAAATRRVWLPWDKGAMYPIVYTLLVGEAGSGKSIAMNYAKQMLAACDLPYSGNIETHQGLLRFMAGEPDKKPEAIPSPVSFLCVDCTGTTKLVHPMNIVGNEFTNFISADELGWMNMLNDIFGQDRYMYRTKGQGTDILEGPHINVLAGLPTEMSHDLQKQKVIASGFSRRTVFQFGERDWNNPKPRLLQTESQLAAFLRCIEHMKSVMKLHGPFHWNSESDAWWDLWYRKHNPLVPKRPPQLRPWYGTKPDRLLQLAMLVSLSDGLSLELSPGHLQAALEFIETMERDLHRVFGGSGRNDLAAVAHAIYNYVAGQDTPLSKRKIMLHFLQDLGARRKAHEEFDECLKMLLETEKIKEITEAIAHPVTGAVVAYEVLIGLPSVIDSYYAARATTPLPPASTAS